MASTTLNVAVPRAVATRSRARRGGMPPVRLASRRGVRCAAGEEVPLGVQIETALMDAFPPRYVGDRTRAHPELEGRAERSASGDSDASNQTLFDLLRRRRVSTDEPEKRAVDASFLSADKTSVLTPNDTRLKTKTKTKTAR
jgi:hypothetical protein